MDVNTERRIADNELGVDSLNCNGVARDFVLSCDPSLLVVGDVGFSNRVGCRTHS